MKALFNKISAFLMALVVMFSTMSFSINKHYCMDHLVDVSFILPADNCGMEMDFTDNTEGSQLTAGACCADEHIAVEGQEDVKPSPEWSPEKQQLVAAAFLYTYSLLFEEEEIEKNEFLDYSPPLITKDLPVIYESYLI